MIACAAMEYFGMTADSEPTKHTHPDNIKRSHKEKRVKAYNEVMDGFLGTIIGPLCFEEVFF